MTNKFILREARQLISSLNDTVSYLVVDGKIRPETSLTRRNTITLYVALRRINDGIIRLTGTQLLNGNGGYSDLTDPTVLCYTKSITESSVVRFALHDERGPESATTNHALLELMMEKSIR